MSFPACCSRSTSPFVVSSQYGMHVSSSTPGGHTALKRSTAVDVGTEGPAALVGHMATTCGGGTCVNFGVD